MGKSRAPKVQSLSPIYFDSTTVPTKFSAALTEKFSMPILDTVLIFTGSYVFQILKNI